MKRYLLITILLLFEFCCCSKSKAQYVTIPDSNFVLFLHINFPMCMNNYQLDTTCLQITILSHIMIQNVQISNLDGIQYFDNLQTLWCDGIHLTQIPSLPPNLKGLLCHQNQLTVLPDLPNNLTQLYCNENLLTSLPTLPTSLQELNCSNNLLSSLPLLGNSITFISCSGNNLDSLSTLPQSLTYLNCQGSNLTILPNLPNNLQMLLCAVNSLTSLPSLPSSLTYLRCGNNLLTNLPSLPNTLTNLYCEYNAITSLPELPDSLGYCYLDYNPLNCLPELKKIGLLYLHGVPIQCIPNYGNVINSVPPLNTFPLCDLFNTNGCNFFYNISGKVFADNNLNCIENSNEDGVYGQKINVFQSGNLIQQSYTSQTGLYSIDTELGNFDYSIDTVEVPYMIACPATGYYNSILTTVDSLDYGMDFGVQCKQGFDIGVVSVNRNSNSFFPGDTSIVRIKAGDISKLYNLNCSSGISGNVVINYSGPVQYVSNALGSLLPIVTPNTLTYNIVDFGTVNLSNDFKFFITTDTTAWAGAQVCFNVTVTPSVSGDLYPDNNQLTHCFAVVNSYDPNNKEANPIGDILPGQEWLTYTINFQNTGNAPAQHIIITDTLDVNLNEATFSFLDSSHDPFIQVSGNVVKFSFPNINLADSTSNEPDSHGYVQYKVKADTGLTIGTVIHNTAAIYFDFNPPVITNTTVNTIVAPTGISEISNNFFTVYPNPSSEKITVRSTSSGLHNLILTDVAGRIVYKKEFTGNEFNFNVNELASGMYFLNLESGGKSEVLKVVVR